MSELPKTPEDSLARYQQLLDQEQAIVKSIASTWSRVGWIRGLLFLVSLFPLFLALNQAAGMVQPWVWLAGLIFVVFIAVAIYHEQMAVRMRTASLMANMHSESIARIQRDWPKIKTRNVEIPVPVRPVAFDLDLVGDSSVFKLLGITRTPLGTRILVDWICEGAQPDEVTARQEAVGELAPQLDWRLEFRRNCEQLAVGRSGPNQFIEWSESQSWLEGRQWILWLARATSLTFLVALLATLSGALPLTISGPIAIVTTAINFALSVFYSGSMHDIFNKVSSRRDEVGFYVALFDMVADYKASAHRLKELQDKMVADNDARQQIKKLGWLVGLANLRRNSFFFVVYLIIEFLFFFDVHVLDLLEKWKAETGEKARGWFEGLGQWEALCALAKFKADHPDWVFPEFALAESKTSALIDAVQLGHPLLNENRVCNDVQMGPPGTVLLVSGSNMSGKSTLLRSLGVNSVLAQMGSVVCAKKMSLPPVHIETSMRIMDSLADGVSFFMAELKRLKEVVDRAKSFAERNDKSMMFLLDEILQGTNSRERQIAVSRVVRKMIDQHAIGAISTHDLDLATTPELEKACVSVHFSEQFHEVDGKKQMTFDYKMKQGIAETTNALKLLEMVGLGEND